jgi:integrase
MLLRDALEAHHAPMVRRRTLDKLRTNVKRFALVTGQTKVDKIDLPLFRAKAVARGYSPWTIETTIADILAILRSCPAELGIKLPDVGKRLRTVHTNGIAPTLDALGRMYAACTEPLYPNRWCQVRLSTEDCAAVVRAFLVACYIAGPRLGDVLHLEWVQFAEDTVSFRASKTGKVQQIPLHPVLKRHLQAVPRTGKRIFESIPWHSRHRLRRALVRLCTDAGVPKVTPQQIRRLAGTEYEKAHGGAGRLLLGHGWPTRATSFYIDELDVLREASRKLRLPQEWLTEQEREQWKLDESQLSTAYRRMSPEGREALIRVAMSLK